MMAGKVLIFGVNGFVGGHLIKEFSEHGYEVFGSDLASGSSHPGLSGYRGVDLLDAGAVDEVVTSYNPDIIVNLAAISSVGQSWKMPVLTQQVNVCGTLNILEASRRLLESPKILLVGSSEEYAASAKPLKETDPINASNPYGISKVTQERFAEVYADQYDMRIYRTRSFNHTGVGQNPNFVIPSWCKQVAEIERSGKSGVIRVGNLDVARDFSDVRDVVRAYRMIVESNYSGEVFNVGSGVAIKLRNVLREVLLHSSVDIEVRSEAALCRIADNPIICSDSSKIEHLLGWRTSRCIEEIIADLYGKILQEVME